jgi:hypothetical protein
MMSAMSISWLRCVLLNLLMMGASLTTVLAADQQQRGGHRVARSGLARATIPVDATSVFLQGDYIEVGIHPAGSFGSALNEIVPEGFHPTQSQLGFVVDGDGWGGETNVPVVGDFFVPGTPEEVWGLTWTNSERQTVSFINAGLMVDHEYDPENGVAPDAGYPKNDSDSNERRCVWTGVATSGTDQSLRVVQTVRFSPGDKFFVMNVVMTNVGKTTITDLKYFRSVDPDQESEFGNGYGTDTDNYVLFQPERKKSGLPAFPADNIDKALVIGMGHNTGIPLGLGAIDGRARVSHGNFSIRDPSWILDLTNGCIDTGREANPVLDDAAISLAFDLGTLVQGQSLSIDYAYILDADDLDKALGQLAKITILQPSGSVSGTSALFQVSTENLQSATVQVDFYVAGQLVGTDDTPSRSGTYEVTFNTLTLNDGGPLPNGPVSLTAVATFADESTSSKSTTAIVDNAGPPIAFTSSSPANGASVIGGLISIGVEGTDVEYLPTQVTMLREVDGQSTVLNTPATAPFTTYFGVDDLPEGTVVVIKVIATDSTGTARTTIARSYISAVFPPGEDTTVTAPTLPLSQGDQTIYVAVSPSTPQGRTSLLATLTGSDNTLTRAFTWDPTIASYVERPSSPTGGIQVSTGIFIATRVSLSYSLDGTSIQAPFTLTLPVNGWVFAGVPPIDTGNGIVTEHLWADTQIWLGGQIQLDAGSTPTLAEAMGDPATPTDSSSARPYFWNGTAYEQVDTLDTGKAYWFKNNLSQPLTLVFGQQALGALAKSVKSQKVFQTPVQIRNQGTPPPPPSGKTKASSSSGGGCGMGSGIASLAFLMLMIGLRFFVVRR